MNVTLRGSATAAEIDIEQLVLGLLLEGSETAWLVFDQISPVDFLESLHQRIAETAKRILDQGRDPTVTTIASSMVVDEGLAEVGGEEYLRRIQGKGRNRDIAKDLIAAFLDHASRRALSEQIEITQVRLQSSFESVTEVLADHQASLQSLTEGRTRPDDPREWYEAGEEVLGRLAEPRNAQNGLLPYGLPALDEKLGGMGEGDLVIVAGRPGMGKTALALCVAYALASGGDQLDLDQPRERAGVFLSSLEMSRAQLLERGLSMRALARDIRVPYEAIHRNAVTPEEQDSLARILMQDSGMPLVIDEARGKTVSQIGARMRREAARMKRRGTRLRLGIVDHLGLIEPPFFSKSRVSDITEITKELKTLARSLGIPIMALCQLSRGVEGREDKRPMLSDLRDSGSIEQDADHVLLLYRAEYYLRKALRADFSSAKKDQERKVELEMALIRQQGKMEIFCDKNRHGPEAQVTLNCNLAYNWIGGAA